MKKFLSLFTIISIILIGGIIFADSNGVWHRAEDVQGGTFAADEMDVTSYFRFIHPVYFDQNIELRNASLNVTGSIFLNGTTIATLDSSGKIPIEQLPFHKGDVVSPANRPLISGQAGYDEYYFDITNLGITGVSASKVAVGTTFGLNNNIQGTYTSDANALSNNILQGKSAYVNGVKIIGTLNPDSICSSVGGTATCGMTSTISPGDFYAIVGSNSPSGINYCEKITLSSDGSISNLIVQTAGVCKYISSCTSASQTISNYNDGTVCGSGVICMSGSCVTASGSNQYTTPGIYTWTAPYAISNLRVEVIGGGGGSSGGDQSAGSAGQGGNSIYGYINVNSGEVLTIYVGEGGTYGTWNSATGIGGFGFSFGGTGGFGASSGSGGGGGGSSAIVKSETPLLVAGGGGGGGGAGFSTTYAVTYPNGESTITDYYPVPYYATGYSSSVNGGNGVSHSADGGGGGGGGAGYPYGGNGGQPNSGDTIGQGGVSGQSYSNPSVTSVSTAVASNGASPSTVSSGSSGGNGYVRISWG